MGNGSSRGYYKEQQCSRSAHFFVRVTMRKTAANRFNPFVSIMCQNKQLPYTDRYQINGTFNCIQRTRGKYSAWLKLDLYPQKILSI